MRSVMEPDLWSEAEYEGGSPASVARQSAAPAGSAPAGSAPAGESVRLGRSAGCLRIWLWLG